MVKVAILGYGTVGSGVYEVLRKNAKSIKRKAGQEIDIKYIVDVRDFPDHPESNLFTKDFNQVLADDEVSVVVEVIGGIKPAYDFTKSALLAGKNVVTSNKELVATHGTELLNIALEKNVNYMFEASVGGGIPIIRPLHQCLAANEVTEIFGILNGTTNYILTKMIKEHQNFDDALSDAQAKGYAERNPAADVDGIDACRKITILSSLAFGKAVDADKVPTRGIRDITLQDVKYAQKLGCVVKLIGHTVKEGERVFCEVSPMLVPDENPLSNVEDVFNAITVKGDSIGEVIFYGKGAGKLPTASAVVADIIDSSMHLNKNKFGAWKAVEEDFSIPEDEIASKVFVVVSSEDRENEKFKVRTLFGEDTDIIDNSSNEEDFAFITESMPLREIKEKLASIQKVTKWLRVLENE
jgi:homoserine dehydrogenase